MPAKAAAKPAEAFAVDAQKAMTEQVEKATKTVETVTAFGQETMDAVMKSQGIAAKAAEELQAEAIAFSKKTVEEGVAHAKDLAAAQTLAEFVEKQAGYAKVTLDAMVRQSTRMNDMMIAAAKDAMAPLSARVSAASELVKAPAA